VDLSIFYINGPYNPGSTDINLIKLYMLSGFVCVCIVFKRENCKYKNNRIIRESEAFFILIVNVNEPQHFLIKKYRIQIQV